MGLTLTVHFSLLSFLLLLRLGSLDCPVFRFSGPSFRLLRSAVVLLSQLKFSFQLLCFQFWNFFVVSIIVCLFIDILCLFRHCSLVSLSSWSLFEIIDLGYLSCKTLSSLPQGWFLSISFSSCEWTIVFCFFVCLVIFWLKTGHSDILLCDNSGNHVLLPCQQFAAAAVEDC